MTLKFQRFGTAIPLQTITKLCIQSKLRYANNFNKLGWRFNSCNSNEGGNDGKSSSGDGPTLYDCRKRSRGLPTNSVCPPFEILCHMPSGVFRETQGEMLGLGAAKRGSCYPNPEYFAYHNMSFFDIHHHLRQYRLPSPDSNRKPLS